MPSSFLPCTDLSNDTRGQTSQHPSGLCTVCHTIDFVFLTRKTCPDRDDGVHFHIGQLRNIARKRFCPGCRLILSVARFTDLSHQELDEATVKIVRRYIYTEICHLDKLSKKPVAVYNMEGRLVQRIAHMESFTEVILNEDRVAGIITRAEETGAADSPGLEPTTPESGEPIFRGRVVLSEVNTSLIKQWMRSCNVQHSPCRLPASATARKQSIRLIDVREHQIIQATLAEKYVTLSYVWGPTMTPTLNRDTISQCTSKGGLKDLNIPRTIMDTIQLVRCIGMRYL